MASLGRLVAGVAHELNKPISFVLGNTHALAKHIERIGRYLDAVHMGTARAEHEALRQQLRIDHLRADLPSLIEGTLEGAQRTADIIGGLKRFSAVDREGREPLDLAEVLERAVHWVRKGTAPGFEVIVEPGPALPVHASRGQRLQVLMNLVRNAYDAAQERAAREGGTPRLVVTRELIREVARGEDGGLVRLKLHDNGLGIAPENLARIFDPFFTTKPVGKGTGLGLSFSYGIVEQHGGRLAAENVQGGGAAFLLELPRAAAPGKSLSCRRGCRGTVWAPAARVIRTGHRRRDMRIASMLVLVGLLSACATPFTLLDSSRVAKQKFESCNLDDTGPAPKKCDALVVKVTASVDPRTGAVSCDAKLDYDFALVYYERKAGPSQGRITWRLDVDAPPQIKAHFEFLPVEGIRFKQREEGVYEDPKRLKAGKEFSWSLVATDSFALDHVAQVRYWRSETEKANCGMQDPVIINLPGSRYR